MRRVCGSCFLLAVLSAIAFAQVTITPQGFATSSGLAVPAAPASPPLLYTPSVHLGDPPIATLEIPAGGVALSPAQLGYLSAGQTWASTAFVAALQPGGEAGAASEQAPPSQPFQAVSGALASPPPFNFGVAQLDSPYSRVAKDENRSVAEIAAAARKQKKQAVRSYSNDDIQKLKR
ncbi:MAG TPA: hypothetical protein VK473_09855 [Terriglobales bacterium]|nr:hypothetical protein [Terriglobales bacterium]